jgi:hypothetical protein
MEIKEQATDRSRAIANNQPLMEIKINGRETIIGEWVN